jgi:hypothetical protein
MYFFIFFALFFFYFYDFTLGDIYP